MTRRRIPMLVLAILLPALAAGQTAAQGSTPAGTPASETVCTSRGRSMPGEPTGSFREFLTTRPRPIELRTRFPSVTVVLPSDVVTQEFRSDCSRFFARLDREGRVVGGSFH